MTKYLEVLDEARRAAAVREAALKDTIAALRTERDAAVARAATLAEDLDRAHRSLSWERERRQVERKFGRAWKRAAGKLWKESAEVMRSLLATDARAAKAEEEREDLRRSLVTSTDCFDSVKASATLAEQRLAKAEEERDGNLEAWRGACLDRERVLARLASAESERDEAKRRAERAERLAHRLQHGGTIEGDDVCGAMLRLASAERVVTAARDALHRGMLGGLRTALLAHDAIQNVDTAAGTLTVEGVNLEAAMCDWAPLTDADRHHLCGLCKRLCESKRVCRCGECSPGAKP